MWEGGDGSGILLPPMNSISLSGANIKLGPDSVASVSPCHLIRVVEGSRQREIGS